MARDFSRFERGMQRIAQLHPEISRDAVTLIRLSYHVFLSLDDRLEQHFARYHLSTSSWIVLMMMYCAPDRRVNPSELSAAVIQSRTQMTRVADDLVAKRLIRRAPSPTDRRRVELTLTATGLKLIEKLLPLTWGEYERALSVFSKMERTRLQTLLQQWLAHLNAGEPAQPAAIETRGKSGAAAAKQRKNGP
jgi:MarR family transcriptional repressor of emrRAB